MNLSSYVVNTKMQKSVCNLFLIDLLESKQSIIIVVWVNFTSIFSPSVHHYFESSLDTLSKEESAQCEKNLTLIFKFTPDLTLKIQFQLFVYLNVPSTSVQILLTKQCFIADIQIKVQI